jgi:hypothetical protein
MAGDDGGVDSRHLNRAQGCCFAAGSSSLPPRFEKLPMAAARGQRRGADAVERRAEERVMS